jgi:hypothetical protein
VSDLVRGDIKLAVLTSYGTAELSLLLNFEALRAADLVSGGLESAWWVLPAAVE